jgi:hypothetical protein
LCRQCYADPAIRDRYPARQSPNSADQCAECRQHGAVYQLGLCRRCYGVEEHRVKHHNGPGGAYATIADHYGGHVLPPPCAALPGSEEKIRVLRFRASKGLALHGARDRRDEVQPSAFDLETPSLG